MRFRPCIDLHAGKVKQIVGSTLTADNPAGLITNFQSEKGADYYARLYREDGLPGGHVIMLGPGNETAALTALAAYPGGLQVGGGIGPHNADRFLAAGASHVIVTSYVFRDGYIDMARLAGMVEAVGKEHLVLDLSCRQRDGRYFVVTDRWQKFTATELSAATLAELAGYCAEFLVHAADVEGKRQGMDEQLLRLLVEMCPLPVAYAGGARTLTDLDVVNELGQGRIDLTIGSALDIFGGDIPYRAVVAWQRKMEQERAG